MNPTEDELARMPTGKAGFFSQDFDEASRDVSIRLPALRENVLARGSPRPKDSDPTKNHL